MTPTELANLIKFFVLKGAISAEDVDAGLIDNQFAEVDDLVSGRKDLPAVRTRAASVINVEPQRPQGRTVEGGYLSPVITTDVNSQVFHSLFHEVESGGQTDFIVTGSGKDLKISQGGSGGHPGIAEVRSVRGVATAGEIHRDKDRTYRITNKSGHFLPDDESLLSFALSMASAVQGEPDMLNAICSLQLDFREGKMGPKLGLMDKHKRAGLIISLHALRDMSLDVPTPRLITDDDEDDDSPFSGGFGGFTRSQPMSMGGSSGGTMVLTRKPMTIAMPTKTVSKVVALPPPPLPKIWQADKDCDSCNACGKGFKFLGRHRHHCRCCGLIFCDKCTSYKANIPAQLLVLNPEKKKTETGALRVCAACQDKLLTVN